MEYINHSGRCYSPVRKNSPTRQELSPLEDRALQPSHAREWMDYPATWMTERTECTAPHGTDPSINLYSFPLSLPRSLWLLAGWKPTTQSPSRSSSSLVAINHSQPLTSRLHVQINAGTRTFSTSQNSPSSASTHDSAHPPGQVELSEHASIRVSVCVPVRLSPLIIIIITIPRTRETN